MVDTTFAAEFSAADAAVGNAAARTDIVDLKARAPVRYLGPVATNGAVPNALSTANKQYMSTSAHRFTDDMAAVRLLFWNGYCNGANDVGERPSGGFETLTASIEYPVGSTPQRITFEGLAAKNSASGDVYLSDAVTLVTQGKRGARFLIHTWQSNTVGIVFAGGRSLGPFEYAAAGATGIVDNTGVTGGTVNNTGKVNNFGIRPPMAILGMTSRPTVAIYGTDMAYGYLDTADYAANIGALARPIGKSMGYINASCSKEKVAVFVSTGSPVRVALANYCSNVVFRYGMEDLRRSAITGAQLLSTLGTFVNLFPGKNILACTLPPGTDAGNTTPAAATEANRVVVNNGLRNNQTLPTIRGVIDLARVTESGYNSGIWRAPYDGDGTAPGPQGYMSIEQSGVITPGMFV